MRARYILKGLSEGRSMPPNFPEHVYKERIPLPRVGAKITEAFGAPPHACVQPHSAALTQLPPGRRHEGAADPVRLFRVPGAPDPGGGVPHAPRHLPQDIARRRAVRRRPQPIRAAPGKHRGGALCADEHRLLVRLLTCRPPPCGARACAHVAPRLPARIRGRLRSRISWRTTSSSRRGCSRFRTRSWTTSPPPTGRLCARGGATRCAAATARAVRLPAAARAGLTRTGRRCAPSWRRCAPRQQPAACGAWLCQRTTWWRCASRRTCCARASRTSASRSTSDTPTTARRRTSPATSNSGSETTRCVPLARHLGGMVAPAELTLCHPARSCLTWRR